MAGFATRNSVAGHPEHSTDTRHALRLETDHLIGAGQQSEAGKLAGYDAFGPSEIKAVAISGKDYNVGSWGNAECGFSASYNLLPA